MTLVEFLSPKWMEIYKAIIRNGVEGEDLSGVEFGMWEVMKNVPERLQLGRGRDILFGFRISGGRLEFPDQPWDDAQFKLIADFESAAPWVNLSAEKTIAYGLMERSVQAGKLRISGGLADAPLFWAKLNLHDRLAEITAPYVASPYWEV